MPVVIDEVVISVEVTGGEPPGAEEGKERPPGAAAADRHALVQEVVEQVMDVLSRRGER